MNTPVPRLHTIQLPPNTSSAPPLCDMNRNQSHTSPSSSAPAQSQPPQTPKSEDVPAPPSLPASDVIAPTPAAPLHPAQTPLEWPESHRRMSYAGPSRRAPSPISRPRPLSMHAGPASQPASTFRLPQIHPQPPPQPPPPTEIPRYPEWPQDRRRALPPVSELVREGIPFSQDEPRLIAPTVPGADRIWYGAPSYVVPTPQEQRQQQRQQQQRQQQPDRPSSQRLFPILRGPPPQPQPQPIPPMQSPVVRPSPAGPSQIPQMPTVPRPRQSAFPQQRPRAPVVQGRQGSSVAQGGVRKRGLQHACTLCSYRAHQSSDLKRHFATHQNLRPFRCPECELRFRQKAHLNAHQLAIHSKLKPHKCDVCTRTFAARSSLKRHVLYVHNRNPPYFCPNCPAQFQRVFDRNRHQASVHGEAAAPPPGGPSQVQLQQQQQQAAAQLRQQQMQQPEIVIHPAGPSSIGYTGQTPQQQMHPQQMQPHPQLHTLQQLQLPQQQFMQMRIAASGSSTPMSAGRRPPSPPPPPAPPPPPPPPPDTDNGQQ